MQIEAELYINDTLVDLSQRNPFPLSYQIADVTKPGERKGNVSKTITLPGTQINEQLFSSIFILSTSSDGANSSGAFLNFDPTVKAKARYYEGGLLVFDGVCQLLECRVENGLREFDITLFSEVVGYFNALQKIKLSALPWSRYTHRLTYERVAQSWEGDIEIDGVITSNAIGGSWNGIGYLYGLIDYGFTRTAENTFNIEELVPQVFVYDILKMAFEAIGVSWESDFLDSNFLKQHLLAWEGGNIPNVPTALASNSSVTTNQKNTISSGSVFLNSFSMFAYTLQQNQGTALEDRYYFNVSAPSQTVFESYNANILTDPGTQVSTDYPFLIQIQEAGIYSVSYSGDVASRASIVQVAYNGNLEEINSYADGTLAWSLSIIVKINNVTVVDQLLFTEVYDMTGAPGSLQVISTVDFSQDFTLESNDTVQVEFKLRDGACSGSFDYPAGPQYDQNSMNFQRRIDIFVQAGLEPRLDVLRTPANFILDQPVNLQYFLPDMDCGTFFKGIVNAFNLYVDEVTGEDSLLKIEPLNQFYKGTNAAKDWSHKLDTEKVIKVVPTSARASKNYILKFIEAKDELSDRYLQATGKNYGQKTLPSNVDFAMDDSVIELPFAIFPLGEIPTTDLIVPRVFKVKDTQTEPIKTGSSIVQAGYGPGIDNQPVALWRLIHGTNSETLEKYPYVGHIDRPVNGTADFSFNVPDFVFYTIPSGGYTTNNLYLRHERFLKELVDKFGKFLIAYFKLNNIDINTRDFSVLIDVDGVIYRLQIISDYDRAKNDTTLCELIRLIEGESLVGQTVTPPNEDQEVSVDEVAEDEIIIKR